MRNHTPKARTRQALWNVQKERPELFNLQPSVSSTDECDTLVLPPGFEPYKVDGWLYNATKALFLERKTGRFCWFDAAADVYRDIHEGSMFPLMVKSGAARQLGSVNAARGQPSSSPEMPAPKHVVIPDLHRAAQALKVDLGHLDRPSAMLAVFGSTADGTGADVSARVLHEKLIKRLAAFRSEWSTEALASAVRGAVEDVSAGRVAVALIVGQRVLAAASGGRCCVPGASLSAGVFAQELLSEPEERTIDVLLFSDPASRLSDAQVLAAAQPRLRAGWPRAACASLLQLAHQQGADGPLTVACARLSPPVATEPVAKRTRISGPDKVRVKQILMRHWRGSGPNPTDPVRRKPITRTLEEADEQMLAILDGVAADSTAFSGACKAVSECQSALKGGELAGDLGWLDREVSDQQGKQSRPSPAIRSVVPINVRRAAFDLEVGELGDLVASDVGVHLLMRTA